MAAGTWEPLVQSSVLALGAKLAGLASVSWKRRRWDRKAYTQSGFVHMYSEEPLHDGSKRSLVAISWGIWKIFLRGLLVRDKANVPWWPGTGLPAHASLYDDRIRAFLCTLALHHPFALVGSDELFVYRLHAGSGYIRT
jgi:hypothetical protein